LGKNTDNQETEKGNRYIWGANSLLSFFLNTGIPGLAGVQHNRIPAQTRKRKK
jgi:hypothetical protein